MTTVHVPYRKLQERKPTEALFNFSVAKKKITMYMLGLPESGKSTIMKQICMANGYTFPLTEKKTLRYHMIKQVVYGIIALINHVEKTNPGLVEEFKESCDAIKSWKKSRLPKSLDLKLLQLLTVPDHVKEAIMQIWQNQEFKNSFRSCCQAAEEVINEDLRMIMTRMEEDEDFRKRFGTENFLPDDDETLLSNGVKYNFIQPCYFADSKNPFLHSKNVNENATESTYYQRPDARSRVLQFPLIAPKNANITRNNFWKITFTEKRGLRKDRFEEKDCIVYTVDVSGYDTPASANLGIPLKDRNPGETVIRRALNDFKVQCKKGHVVAVVFTHIDVLYKKYREEKIPLDVMNDFLDCPQAVDEDDGSICLALAYFRSKFQDAMNESFKTLQGNYAAERSKELFKIFCINGLDYENIQGTLKALLEQFFGLNIPINAAKADAVVEAAAANV